MFSKIQRNQSTRPSKVENEGMIQEECVLLTLGGFKANQTQISITNFFV
jgi:hypothetical protein